MNILEKIVEAKKREIERLYDQYDLRSLSEGLTHSRPGTRDTPRFYRALAESRAAGRPFFIAEFKRKSPSEGWINREADLPAQVRAYAEAGAGAVSVLTDEPFFGGSYADLELAAQTIRRLPTMSAFRAITQSVAGHRPPLLLQKDFILDPIQIYLARRCGADIILLIAAILEPEQLDFLKKTAESLGMGVLVEVHDAEELAKIQHLDFPVSGVNNRDLKTFRTALNRVNVLCAGPRGSLTKRFVIAESGIRDYIDFQSVRHADGFLIGTGLMRNEEVLTRFEEHFQSRGRFLFKACGIRTPEMLVHLSQTMGRIHDPAMPDLIGINFSPVSKRRIDHQTLEVFKTCRGTSNAVAVFYKNAESDIREILEQYSFRAVQLYAGDVAPGFVRSLKHRVFMAVRLGDDLPWSEVMARCIEPYAADVDLFILDGAAPGSGQRIGTPIPEDFPYPFLLAGGLNGENLETILNYKNCIGVDIASGIEMGGQVDTEKIRSIAERLSALHPVLGCGVVSE